MTRIVRLANIEDAAGHHYLRVYHEVGCDEMVLVISYGASVGNVYLTVSEAERLGHALLRTTPSPTPEVTAASTSSRGWGHEDHEA